MRHPAALCPGGAFLPVDGAKYRRESRRVMEILGRFTPLLEQVSIDEAFLDVAGSEALFGPPDAIARQIRDAVRGCLRRVTFDRRLRLLGVRVGTLVHEDEAAAAQAVIASENLPLFG